jgi:hypothetical protein
MIFLSDGQCPVPDTAIQDVCLSAVRLGCVAFFWLNFHMLTSPKKTTIFSFYLLWPGRFFLFPSQDGQCGARSPE